MLPFFRIVLHNDQNENIDNIKCERECGRQSKFSYIAGKSLKCYGNF